VVWPPHSSEAAVSAEGETYLPPFPSSGAATIEGVLTTAETSINGQIASLRAYFRTRLELLRLLDTSMKQEFKAIERWMRRYTLLSNFFFTALGVVLGLLAPVAFAAIVIGLSSIGR
jgi:hypothetical protein